MYSIGSEGLNLAQPRPKRTAPQNRVIREVRRYRLTLSIARIYGSYRYLQA